MYPEKPPPYISQSIATLQSDHSSGPTRPPIPQSHPQPFHSIPNAHASSSRPQAHRFDQSAPPRFNVPPGTVPSQQPFPITPYPPHGTIAQAVRPQAPRKINAFVASNPFRMFRDDDKIDIPSDGLTFDDIPTAEFSPGNSAPPPAGTYAQGIRPIRPIFYPTSDNLLSSRASDLSTDQTSNFVPSNSDYQVEYCEVQPMIVPLSSMGSLAERSRSEVFSELFVPPSPTTEPSITGSHASSPSHPEDETFSHVQEESIFTRFARFFRFGWSYRAHSQRPNAYQPSTVLYHDSDVKWHKFILKFVLVTLPGQLYLLFLLRLPSLYFSRVSRIFEEAQMSLPEIKKMALEMTSQGLTHDFGMQMAFESPSVPLSFKRLASTWECFIDSVIREWKTFNIISVLLLTAILTILQIESAADDPLTRYTALFSLMCALISLLFGCMYIIRFGSMRKSYKAAEWALEAQKTRMLIWWNVWVLLAMPAIWLTWSIILYIACILSFIWRTGVTDTTTPPGLSDTGFLTIRIVLTVILGIGLLYGFLILKTFRRYGVVMDKAWQKRIDEWVQGKAREQPPGTPFIYPPVDNQYPPMDYGHPLNSSYSDNRTLRSYASGLTPPIKRGINQDEYSLSRETTLNGCYYTPIDAIVNPPRQPSCVVSPRRPLPPIPQTPITSFADQSSEVKDNAEEKMQSLRFNIPKKLGVSPPPPPPSSPPRGPRPLPPIPETPATPFVDQSSEGGDNNALENSMVETGNGDDDDIDDMYI